MNQEEVQQKITEKVIKALENGDIAAFRRPWLTGMKAMNFVTKRAYEGMMNIFLLGIAQLENDYPLPLWATYHQISKLGKVKSGEKANHIVFYKQLEFKDTGTDTIKRVPYLKFHPVFNLAQTDLDQDKYESLLLGDRKEFSASTAEQTLLNTGVTIRNSGESAHYVYAEDYIRMPIKKQFSSESQYLAVLAHELIHWSGHTFRLHRETLLKYHDDLEMRAKEELVAELGSMMLCSSLSIESDVDSNHISYIKSWLTALKDDHSLIFKCAKEATKSVEYILQQQEKVLLDAREAS